MVRVMLDPQRLAGYGLDLNHVRQGIVSANQSFDNGRITRDNREITIQAGTFLIEAAEIGSLVIGLSNGVPIHLRDVARIELNPVEADQYVWFGTGPAAGDIDLSQGGRYPAITLAIAKKPGSNAIDVANQVIERVNQLKGLIIPGDVTVTVSRNYGATANEKAMTLIQKLMFARCGDPAGHGNTRHSGSIYCRCRNSGDAGPDPVCLLGLGIYPESRFIVRPDFLDRYPG